MHAADVKKSARLRRFVSALNLAGQKGLTTRDLIQQTGDCAISAIAAEVRENGYVIDCQRESRTTWRYRLVEQGQQDMFGKAV